MMMTSLGLECLQCFGEISPRISASSHTPSSSAPKYPDNRTHSNASKAGDTFFISISFFVSSEQSVRVRLKLWRAFSTELMSLKKRLLCLAVRSFHSAEFNEGG